MPYKSKEARNAAIRRSKEKYREKYKQRSKEYYLKKRGELKPRPVRTKEELKAMKAADDRRYREKHKDKLKKKKAEYYQRNKKRINQKWLEKLNSDIQARLAHNIRNRVKQAVCNGYKVGSGVKELGCSILEFKEYITKKFIPGMSWENYGEWHLDHIKPLCNFNLESQEQFKLAVHYTNYQPLWAKDNLRKNKY